MKYRHVRAARWRVRQMMDRLRVHLRPTLLAFFFSPPTYVHFIDRIPLFFFFWKWRNNTILNSLSISKALLNESLKISLLTAALLTLSRGSHQSLNRFIR